MKRQISLVLLMVVAIFAMIGCEEASVSPVSPDVSENVLESNGIDSNVNPENSEKYGQPFEQYPYSWKLPFCGRYKCTRGYNVATHRDGNGCNSQNRYALDFSLPGEQDNGDPIVAPASGWVEFSGQHGGYGNAIVINAGGGYFYRIAHLKKDFVVEGQFVSQGDLIGEVGNTGNSTGSHIHFSIHYPASYSGGGRICGESISQDGLSYNWGYRANRWYSSRQNCQSIP